MTNEELEKTRTENFRLRHQIRELEELNKMLQKNMFHYEYRARDEGVENIKLQCLVDELRTKLANTEALDEK